MRVHKAPEPKVEAVEAPKVAVKGEPVDHNEMLRHQAHIIREDAADLIARGCDPTSPFILKRFDIANAIDAFLALCEERGHRGIPNG